MDIKFESHQSNLEKAFQAGIDFAKGERDESNIHEKHFKTTELANQWQKGYEKAYLN